MTEAETIQYAVKAALALSKKSDEGRFSLEEPVTVMIDGEEKTFTFSKSKSDTYYEDVWFSQLEHNICITLMDENYDSWGEMYANDGINFSVEKIVEIVYEPRIKTEYISIDQSDFPFRNEW